MSVVKADKTIAEQLLDMKARLEAAEAKAAELEAAAAANAARNAGAAGWFPKTIKPLTAEQIAKGSKMGLMSAERILAGGLVVSYYVGGNGKLTIGGTYATRGVTLWRGDRATLKAYREDTGPDGESADLDRVLASGVWGTGEGVARAPKKA